jgi:RNA polymerase sigma-70 factor (ECF subfamily)
MTDQTVPKNDMQIIDDVLHGNTALFELLIRRYNAELYKLARCYGFNHQDAEDLMQETYLSAYSNLYQFQHRSSFKTWISKILIHKCLYKLNYGHKNKEIADPATLQQLNDKNMAGKPGFPEAMARKEFARVLEITLQELPLIYRLAFILREVEGYSVAETSEVLGITPINVKVRTNRAKALLQKKLETYYSAADIYEFNLVYCDKIAANVLNKIQAGPPE